MPDRFDIELNKRNAAIAC